MPDLTFQSYQMCESMNGPKTAKVGGYLQLKLFHERMWATCTCPAYKFAVHGKINFGGRMVSKHCKHIAQAQKEVCGWHEAFSFSMKSAQDKKEEDNMVCPSCGGETVWVLVAG